MPSSEYFTREPLGKPSLPAGAAPHAHTSAIAKPRMAPRFGVAIRMHKQNTQTKNEEMENTETKNNKKVA